MKPILTCLALNACATLLFPLAAAAQAPDAKGVMFFENKVRPLLAEHCYECHSAGAKSLKGGLSLDRRDGVLKGGQHGPVVVPGDPGQSVLIRAVRRVGELQMPPKHELNKEQVGILIRWVKIGAPWPAELAPLADAEKPGEVNARYEQIRREHWAFQPVRKSEAPQAKQTAWAKTDVDRFILDKLEAKQLKPSPQADRRTLIRRATFDLTGLPPTPEEVESFVNDNSAKAFEKVVDRLLASPGFGERWGRHWLDVARYAESTGMTRNVPFYYAWRYRDYVIDAFNADTPYDRFVREQVAGDLMPAQGEAARDRQLIATGFLTLGPKDLNEGNPAQFVLNNVDEQIDTTSRAFLGLTVSCARCHDHKFDPIPTAEYYAMAGIFRSTELLAGVTSKRGGKGREYYDPDLLVPLSAKAAAKPVGNADDFDSDDDAKVMPIIDDAPAANAQQAKQQAMQAQTQKAREDQQRRKTEARRKRLLEQRKRQRQLQEQALAERDIRPVTGGVRDGRVPADSHIFVRGELKERGPIVPRGTITLPGMQGLGTIPWDRSGRLELAGWLTNRSNPMTARVMVNRVWQHLFGQGLVTTVDNFGTTGESPSHPELLDHLAAEFMDDGWSVKRAIRRLMLSSVYQQASTFDEAKFTADPENKLVWRMSPRRLEGEAIRDAVLAAAGNLNAKRPQGSPAMNVPPMGLNRRVDLGGRFAIDNDCRSVYLPIFRGFVPDALDVFDLADNNNVTGSRDVTTVAPQALFMMNDPFVLAQSKGFALRVMSERSADLARIDRAYSLALGRVPNDAERQRALRYVRAFADGAKDPKRVTPIDPWTGLCQALFASAEFRYLN